MPQRPANPKIRITGAIAAALGAYLAVVAVTGLGVDSTGARIAVGVFGALLILVGVSLLRARTPGLRSISADSEGLHVELVDGGTEIVPWTSIETVALDRLSKPSGGVPESSPLRGEATMLRFTYRDGAPRVAALAAFERDGRVLLGVPNARTRVALRQQLPAAAGERYRG